MAPPVSTCEQDRLGEHFSHAFRQTAISVSFTILQAASYSVYTQALLHAALQRRSHKIFSLHAALYSVYTQLHAALQRSFTTQVLVFDFKTSVQFKNTSSPAQFTK